MNDEAGQKEQLSEHHAWVEAQLNRYTNEAYERGRQDALKAAKQENEQLSKLIVEQEREYHKGRKDAERENERLCGEMLWISEYPNRESSLSVDAIRLAEHAREVLQDPASTERAK